MGLQDTVENRYRKFAGRDHRKTYAQFFTPIPVATVMAAFILDNPNCRLILDPAAGLLGFSRAADDILTLINSGQSTELVNLIYRQVEETKVQLLKAPSVKAAETKAPVDPEHSVLNVVAQNEQNKKSQTLSGREFRFRSLYNKLSSIKPRGREVSAAPEPLRLSANERKLLARNFVEYPEYLNTRDTWFNPNSLLLNSTELSAPGCASFSLSPRYHLAYCASTDLNLTLSAQLELNPATDSEFIPQDLNLRGQSNSSGFHDSPELPDYESIIKALDLQDDTSFSRMIPAVNMVSYELDPLIFGAAQASCQEYPFGFVNNRLKCCDYLSVEINERFDGIICNPPYMSYRDFTKLAGGESPALTEDLPRRTNTYTLFLLQSLKQLSSKGRCAYLIPYEFLNSSIGVKVKTELLKERSLCSVIIFKIPIFEGAITTTGLFLFDKGKHHQNVEFLTITSLDELPALAVHLCPNLLGDLPQPQLQSDPFSSDSHAQRTARSPVPATPVAAVKAAQARAPKLKPSLQLSAQDPAAIKAAVTQVPALLDTFTPNQLTLSGVLTQPNASLAQGINLEPIYESQYQLLELLVPESQSDGEDYTLTLRGQTVPYYELDAERKWHTYYQGTELKRPPAPELNPEPSSAPYQDSGLLVQPPVTPPQAPNPIHWVKGRGIFRPLSDFIKVKRGIATGANEFFLFNHEEMKRHHLNPRFFIPALARANMAPYPILTLDDFVKLAAEGQRVFLLSPPPEIDDPYLLHYLKLGVEQGVDKRYLTSHRNPWYTMERRELAPLFISVFNRGSFNVIRNDVRIYNLTAFHSLFVHNPELTDIVFAYLLTPLASELIMANRREYGRGLEKLEPTDIMESKCIDFNQLSIEQLTRIRDLIAQYEVIIDKARHQNENLLPQSLYQRALDHVLRKLSEIFAELT